MKIFAAVPVKSFVSSKSRLSNILSPEERSILTIKMLNDVINTLADSKEFSRVAVISREPGILDYISDKNKVCKIKEKGESLNPAISQITEWSIMNGASSLLAVPCDIPLIKVKDVHKILELGEETNSVVLSPSKDGGTNALYRNPSDLISSSFGQESLILHILKAIEAKVKVELYRSQTTALDIDTIDDIVQLLEAQSETLTSGYLLEIDILKRIQQHAAYKSS